MTPIRKKMLKAFIKTFPDESPRKMNNRVKKWLNSPPDIKRNHCPFDPHGMVLGECRICKAMFNKVRNSSRYILKDEGMFMKACPCNLYSTKYITQRAREALK